MKFAFDTDVVVAAVRSPGDASAALVRALQAGQLRVAASVALFVEDEATCTRAEGISMNQFIATAVAEKLSVLSTADFFLQRAQRAKPDALDKILRRSGGQTPRAGDELA